MGRKKYFYLKGVNGVEEILRIYGGFVDVIPDTEDDQENTDNNVSDIRKSIEVLSNLKDEDGRSYPMSTTEECWWCRQYYDHHPIGCPLRLVNSFSQREISLAKEYFRRNNIKTDIYYYFECEGLFCSFSCVKAYILEHQYSALYHNSGMLLEILFVMVNGPGGTIPVAPDWRALKKGIITPEMYALHGIEDDETRIKYTYRPIPTLGKPLLYVSSAYVRSVKEERIRKRKQQNQ